jgi:hypothetical protein
MKWFCGVMLLAALVVICPFDGGADTGIVGYRPVFSPCHDAAGKLQVAIRSYETGSVSYCLLVNPATLETSIARTSALAFRGEITSDTLAATPFVRALRQHTSPPYKLQNHGARRADCQNDGVFLTVDMCPSKRPFEREFFAAVGRRAHGKGATPVAVAMTGAWLASHPGELAWLRREMEGGRLAITWVNHSLTHPYDATLPLTRNFLLTAGVNFDREVLATEVLLLERGLLPSPFFRFPGLVAAGPLLERLRELSLIPLGSDAWLAKGEAPSAGSFVLVHGNGNEPKGIARVLPLLQNDGFRLAPLREAFAVNGQQCGTKD